MGGIPSGTYFLLAIDDGAELEWHRYEVLAHYLPLAARVIIPAGGKMPMNFAEPLVVQRR